MPLWIVTVTRQVWMSGVMLEPGMSVEVPSRVYNSMNRMHISCNKEINDAFIRKYGIDLERAGLLSSYYLEATLVGEGDRKSSVKGSLFSMVLDLFT